MTRRRFNWDLLNRRAKAMKEDSSCPHDISPHEYNVKHAIAALQERRAELRERDWYRRFGFTDSEIAKAILSKHMFSTLNIVEHAIAIQRLATPEEREVFYSAIKSVLDDLELLHKLRDEK